MVMSCITTLEPTLNFKLWVELEGIVSVVSMQWKKVELPEEPFPIMVSFHEGGYAWAYLGDLPTE